MYKIFNYLQSINTGETCTTLQPVFAWDSEIPFGGWSISRNCQALNRGQGSRFEQPDHAQVRIQELRHPQNARETFVLLGNFSQGAILVRFETKKLYDWKTSEIEIQCQGKMHWQNRNSDRQAIRWEGYREDRRGNRQTRPNKPQRKPTEGERGAEKTWVDAQTVNRGRKISLESWGQKVEGSATWTGEAKENPSRARERIGEKVEVGWVGED